MHCEDGTIALALGLCSLSVLLRQALKIQIDTLFSLIPCVFPFGFCTSLLSSKLNVLMASSKPSALAAAIWIAQSCRFKSFQLLFRFGLNDTDSTASVTKNVLVCRN